MRAATDTPMADPTLRPSTPTMRALVLEEPGKLSLSQVGRPSPGPGEVLIRVQVATTCGTDLKAYLRGHPQIPMPGVFGHEYSGTVAAVGPGAAFAVGEDVMGVHSAPCQECAWCRRGQENLCEHIMRTKVLGSFAEYLLIPEHVARLNLYPKPDHVSFERASLLEPLSCVAQALDLLAPEREDRVLVIGPGAIGLMFVAALRHLGVQNVALAGRNKARLTIGESLGAQAIRLSDVPKLVGDGFDCVLECTGSVEVWESSFGFVRRGGRVVLFGGCPPGTHVSIDTRRLHYDQVTVLSPFHFGTQAVSTAREWLLDPSFDIDAVLSGERDLSDAENVFADLLAGHGVKYCFRP